MTVPIPGELGDRELRSLDASGLAPDSVRRLSKELRHYAKDRYTPGEITHVLTAAADTLDMLFVKRPKQRSCGPHNPQENKQ